MIETHLIELDNVSKRFGGVVALDQVSFGIRRGEIHAVVGENGAGKSTLMKLLAGVHVPDQGEIRIDGRAVRLRDPRAARRHGISIVFQELNLFPERSVTANLFANRERVGRSGLLQRKGMKAAARGLLKTLDVTMDPDTLVGRLSIGEQQLVEIARTLDQQARIIILDEPNSALTEAESQRLFGIIDRLRDQGVTLVYVSHRLEEVFAIADRITVLRSGQYQGTYDTSTTSTGEVIKAMIGRSLKHSFPTRPQVSTNAPVELRVLGLCRGARLGPVSLEARAGEIVGFAGLEGAGVDELFQVLFGLDRPSSGEMIYRDRQLPLGSPYAAIQRGLALVPESRRDQGLLLDWSIARNTTLVVLDKLRTLAGLLDKSAIRTMTKQFVQRMNIEANTADQKVVNLSGGNQQKVLLAKWLSTGPSLLILNDPTRGVDLRTKSEIYQQCAKLAASGVTLLLASSEVDELLGLADRILVLRAGKIVRQFQRNETTKAELMHEMAGG